MKQVIKLYLFSLLTIFLSAFVSCQTKPIQTIFESGVEDTSTKLNDTKIYVLKKQTINSDFDYSKLDDIDDSYGRFHKPKKIITAFEPIDGQYNYYQFIATFKGQSYNDAGPTLIKEFHDILIIKTDSKNKIIDAYQYTLEWSEPPFQNDVYKSTVKNLLLTNNLQLNTLKLTKTYDGWDEKDKKLNENGIIRLK
ncbi:MAG: hypothetical protein RLZZ540_650 [Bacteroidota bacterium]|jgi:hypothetical protein